MAAPEAPRANVSVPNPIPPAAASPNSPSEPAQESKEPKEIAKDQRSPAKEMHDPSRRRERVVALPKPRPAAARHAKARPAVAHATSRPHRSKPTLLARLLTKPFKDIGKAFRVSQRKTYRAQPVY